MVSELLILILTGEAGHNPTWSVSINVSYHYEQ